MKPSPVEPNQDPDIERDAVIEASEESATDNGAPEVEPATAQLTEWDSIPATTGKVTPRVLPEDEVSAAEKLVEEGAEEAERERRMAAADPDFEP